MNNLFYLIFISIFVLVGCNENKMIIEKEFSVPEITVTDKWQNFEPFFTVKINKGVKNFKIQDFLFIIDWTDTLCENENKRNSFYAGVKKLEIIRNDKTIQIIENIKDEDGLGEVLLNVFDFNFDENFDFTLPLNACGKSCYYKYYLFNSKANSFSADTTLYFKRIQEVNTKEKLIKTVMEGTCCEGDYYIYKIDGLRFVELEKVHVK